MSEIELLPCPVCGSMAVAGASTNPGGPTTVWVGCPACHTRTFDSATIEDAATAWNRRPAGPLEPPRRPAINSVK
ncbi:MAG: Lar family restriction alleviation protein [Acidobacteria bacterium]|nr:Lar family restriction alleviation protein [Acidobacteriota bacterium]